MISRRKFQRALGSMLCTTTVGVRAQTANRVYRVTLLRPTAAPPTLDPVSAEVILSKAFARMGYQEGANFHLEHRYGDGDPQRLQAVARELVQQRTDVIMTVSPTALRAASPCLNPMTRRPAEFRCRSCNVRPVLWAWCSISSRPRQLVFRFRNRWCCAPTK